MDKVELLAKIDGAKRVIAEAEGELARVLGYVGQLPRAEKQKITEAIQTAVTRLHQTQTDLVALLGAVKDDGAPIE